MPTESCATVYTVLPVSPDDHMVRAYKGNVIVAMKISLYNHKVQELLNDTGTYSVVNKNPN